MREKLKKKEAEKERVMEDNKRHTCRGRINGASSAKGKIECMRRKLKI